MPARYDRHMGIETFFREQMIAQGRAIAALGATDAQIAEILGVGVRTLYRWKAEIPQFAAALEEGKAAADDIIEQSVFQRARNGDLRAARWWLRARRPDIFRSHAENGRQAPPAAAINAMFSGSELR